MTDRPKCETCYHYLQLPEVEGKGLCKRYPPATQREPVGLDVAGPAVPTVAHDDSCGEHRAVAKHDHAVAKPAPTHEAEHHYETKPVHRSEDNPKGPPTPKVDAKAEPINPSDKTPAQKKKHRHG